MTSIYEQAVALSAIAQVAVLVDQVACGQSLSEPTIEPLIYCLFQFDADSTEAVYGDVDKLALGAKTLHDILNHKSDGEQRPLMRYINGMFTLESQLRGDSVLLEAVGARLKHIKTYNQALARGDFEQYSAIAAVYTDTISNLPYRIKVSGSPEQLQKPYNAEKIRSLLFAGIRSAILWRQLGGKRRHLLLKRKQLSAALLSITQN